MKYAEEVDMADGDNLYAVGDDGNNGSLAEGNDDKDDGYASTASCAESIILSGTPVESIILSALPESIYALPAESIAHSRLESQNASMPSH
jgi:hypothetical protein